MAFAVTLALIKLTGNTNLSCFKLVPGRRTLVPTDYVIAIIGLKCLSHALHKKIHFRLRLCIVQVLFAAKNATIVLHFIHKRRCLNLQLDTPDG
jgi:hypothetical protein